MTQSSANNRIQWNLGFTTTSELRLPQSKDHFQTAASM